MESHKRRGKRVIISIKKKKKRRMVRKRVRKDRFIFINITLDIFKIF